MNATQTNIIAAFDLLPDQNIVCDADGTYTTHDLKMGGTGLPLTEQVAAEVALTYLNQDGVGSTALKAQLRAVAYPPKPCTHQYPSHEAYCAALNVRAD